LLLIKGPWEYGFDRDKVGTHPKIWGRCTTYRRGEPRKTPPGVNTKESRLFVLSPLSPTFAVIDPREARKRNKYLREGE